MKEIDKDFILWTAFLCFTGKITTRNAVVVLGLAPITAQTSFYKESFGLPVGKKTPKQHSGFILPSKEEKEAVKLILTQQCEEYIQKTEKEIRKGVKAYVQQYKTCR